MNTVMESNIDHKKTNKLCGLSPRTNYTNITTAACQRSKCQLLWIEGIAWSAGLIPTSVLSDL
jgi:hypothetical protein